MTITDLGLRVRTALQVMHETNQEERVIRLEMEAAVPEELRERMRAVEAKRRHAALVLAEAVDEVDALLVACRTCAAPAGSPCVNTLMGTSVDRHAQHAGREPVT